MFTGMKHNNVHNFTELLFNLKFKNDTKKSIFIQNCEFSKFEIR